MELEPAFVIRSPNERSDADFVLFDVGDIVTLSDGRIVIENQGTSELLVFDASGSYLSAWGGRGEGPGEYRRMRRMFACPGDRILVQEYDRATILDATGGVVMTTPRRRIRGIPARVLFHGVSRNCASALWGWYPSRYIESPRRTVWQAYDLAWVPYKDQPIDELGTFARIELEPESHWELPFSLAPDWATDGELIYYGLGDAPEVRVLGRDRTVVRLIRWPASPEPITDADWTTYNRGFDRLVGYNPSLEGSRIKPGMLPFDSMPVFGRAYFGREWVPGLRLDDEGNLWIRQYKATSMHHRVPSLRGPIASQRWWIFDRDGRWLGELETPDNLHIRSIRDGLILGVGRDEFDAEEIRAHRIRRRNR